MGWRPKRCGRAAGSVPAIAAGVQRALRRGPVTIATLLRPLYGRRARGCPVHDGGASGSRVDGPGTEDDWRDGGPVTTGEWGRGQLGGIKSTLPAARRNLACALPPVFTNSRERQLYRMQVIALPPRARRTHLRRLMVDDR
jgi:hypothetical protein